MTVKDLFRFLLKLFGTYSLLISIFTVIPQNVSSLAYIGEDILLGFWLFLILAIVIGLYLFIIFKTDLIIHKLGLHKGFDNDKIILDNISDFEIYKFAIIMLGGFLIIDNLPVMISQIMYIFKANLNADNVVFNNKSIYDYFDLLITVLSLLIGYLFVNNYRYIAEFLSKK